MEIPYGFTEKIKINQHAKPALTTQMDAHRAALLLLPEKAGAAAWNQLPYAGLLRPRYQQLQHRNRQATPICIEKGRPYHAPNFRNA